MVSKDVKKYVDEIGIDRLYKKFEKYFNKLDEWEDKLIDGDLLNQQELKHIGEVATGIYGKLSVVVNALDSIKERKERNTEYTYFKECEKVKTTDMSIAKAKARDAVNDLREYYGDFKAYLDTADKMIFCSQNRLKCENNKERRET